MIPEFKSMDDKFKFLRERKNILITQKKSAIKLGDAVCNTDFDVDEKSGIYTPKAFQSISMDFESLSVKAVINTCNIRDSHKDVHIPGIWIKNLKEKKERYLLKEHKMSFENIIADSIKAYVENLTWKQLGQKWQGETEALIYDAQIEKARNEYMAEQYAKGRVKQHSVGMIYIRLFLAMNSGYKSDKEEKEIWDKYIAQIVNRDETEEDGYFWAVTEAKNIEGSAVPLGSNYVTPPLSIEPAGATQNEPDAPSKTLDWGNVAEAFKAAKN